MKTRQIETVLLRLVANDVLLKTAVRSDNINNTIYGIIIKIIEDCVYAH